MRYVDVALTDPQREFQLVHDKPRHLAPQPKSSPSQLRAGLNGFPTCPGNVPSLSPKQR
jgi:hypothetical protein